MKLQSVKFMLMVENMARAVAFYRDTIGLSLASESPYWSELTHGDAIVALHGGREDSAHRATGLSFTVSDIHGAVQEVAQGGGKVLAAPEDREGEPIWLADCEAPEGNGFMLSMPKD